MMHICSAPVQGFHIHNLLAKRSTFYDKNYLLVGTEQMLISFDTLCAYVGRDKESWFANHLFHTSQDFTSLCQISLQLFRSKADESYLTLLLLIQKLLHWLFSKFSQSTSSIQRPAYFWSEMHQGLIRWLQHSFPLRPLSSMTILNTPFASLIIAQPELSSPPEDLFSLEDIICD